MIGRYYRRRTERRRAKREGLEFDTTPIADLSFNLLIFFIVTASFILRQGVFLSLPSSSAGVVRVDEKRIVDITPDNEAFMLGAERLGRDETIAVLKKKKAEDDEVIAVIHMKSGVRYERLVDALSVARESKILKISLKDTMGFD